MELRDKYPLTLWRGTSREMVRTFTVDPYVIDLELIKSILPACPTISELRIIVHDAKPVDVGYHISRVMDMALFSSNQQIKRLALVGNYDGAIVSVDVASSTPGLTGFWPMLRGELIDADPFIHFANNAAEIDLSTPNMRLETLFATRIWSTTSSLPLAALFTRTPCHSWKVSPFACFGQCQAFEPTCSH